MTFYENSVTYTNMFEKFTEKVNIKLVGMVMLMYQIYLKIKHTQKENGNWILCLNFRLSLARDLSRCKDI